jgi:RNA:NAD 2'-phosphotransferase (TPT1/KptA family)
LEREIEPLAIELENKEALGRTLSCILEHEGWARRGKLTNNHYVHTMDKALNCLKQTMEKLSSNLYPRINLDSMTTMAYSIRPYTSNYLSILLLINQMI